MDIKKIESLAEKILDDNGVKNSPVLVEELAEKLNIQIKKASSEDFSGLLLRKEGVSLIGINSKEPITRQRFSIAHELGHYCVHHNKDVFVDYLEYRNNKKESGSKIKETEANMFAAALLMPRKWLERDFENIVKNTFEKEHLKLLAEKYGVSEDAMNFRIINLRLN